MKKNKGQLDHALHNEEAALYIGLKESFSDWLITTSFYASLHFVSYKIFPYEVKAVGGKNTWIETIDHLYNYIGQNNKSKHQLLNDLVYKHCPEIYDDYNWLLDASMNARYVSYQYPKEVGQKALRLMQSIKKYCTKV